MKVTRMADRYNDRRRSAQPPGVMKVELESVRGDLRSQWQRDGDWSEGGDDWFGIRRRPMIEPERIEFKLRIPPGYKGVVITASCSDCRCRYIKPVIVPAADAAELLYMSDDETFAWMDDATSRFFRHITEPWRPICKCNRCGSYRCDGDE